jgi:hypothetical protein
MTVPISISLPIIKTAPERRVAYGWASVVERGGRAVIDAQGDVIAVEDLIDAAHGFMAKAATAGVMHHRLADGTPMAVGRVVESLVLTADVQKALGVDLGLIGWFVGLKIDSDPVWAAIKDGTVRAFSIGGRAVRQPLAL